MGIEAGTEPEQGLAEGAREVAAGVAGGTRIGPSRAAPGDDLAAQGGDQAARARAAAVHADDQGLGGSHTPPMTLISSKL